MRKLTRLFLAGVFAAAAAFGATASASGERDHNEARRALERGEALPLADVIARVRPELGGEVVGVSFKRRESGWVYEFKVIGPAGRLGEIYVDAATARVVKKKYDDADPPRRR